ncbi:hypothetical protein V1517DRAFT_376064 [Lipomyces orientalis]|uniref:Uncharacterized protein n=1 Tax=Lipomyces orientalis TaxID=1233043 RepID=A0ACC3TG52_9ASCO
MSDTDPKVFVAHVDDAKLENTDAQARSDAEPSWWVESKGKPESACVVYIHGFTCIAFGYDGVGTSIAISLPQFRESYGYLFGGQWVVTEGWQLAFIGGFLAGTAIDGIFTGIASKYAAQKLCLMCTQSTMASWLTKLEVIAVAGVLLQWFSPGNVAMFFAGKTVTGLSIGCFVTVFRLRAPHKGSPEKSFLICLPSNGALRISYPTEARGKVDQARESIKKLYSPSTNVDDKIREISEVLDESHSGGSYRQCFDAKNRLRTLIALSVFVARNAGL